MFSLWSKSLILQLHVCKDGGHDLFGMSREQFHVKHSNHGNNPTIFKEIHQQHWNMMFVIEQTKNHHITYRALSFQKITNQIVCLRGVNKKLEEVGSDESSHTSKASLVKPNTSEVEIKNNNNNKTQQVPINRVPLSP